MKRFASFIVDRRIFVLIAMLIAAGICGVLSLQVEVNTDMTKYLPDDSSMKQGIDVMDEQFPNMETSYTIRVMFTGLPDTEKQVMLDALESIPHVDSVEYKADDEDYNKDDHTLYIINTLFDFNTEETLSIERVLQESFSSYDMTYKLDTSSGSSLTPLILFMAIALVMVILFAMCASWLEPFVLLAGIAVSVVFNMGTNIIFDSISEVTSSICSILQMVLSMDYSIILLNRYRQELEQTQDKYEAMKAAIVNSFASITSSSITTIVGLLVLLFMSFKIGADLGLVLAKGVFFSLFCNFTLLPGLILLCDKGIKKTAKKVLPIKMDIISNFSYRFRYVIIGVFVVLFAGATYLQNQTQISYMMEEPDPIAEVFPESNIVVVLFDNDDEQMITDIANHVKTDENVKDVLSFSTTIGKPYTSAELADELDTLGEDSSIDLDASILDILYYYYYKDGETGNISTGDFLRFIANDVANNATFADNLDDDIKANLDMLSVFAEKDELLTPKSIAELADIFGMDAKDLSNLFVFYYGENDGATMGTMTLPQFTSFIQSDILTDKDFSDLLDKDALEMMDLLQTVTNRNEILAKKAAADVANTLDMELDDVDLLYLYYFGKHGAADNLELTFPQFASLIDEILVDTRFADVLDEGVRENVDKLAIFADRKKFQTAQTSSEVANALGMESDMAELLYAFYFAKQGAVNEKVLTVPQFVKVMEDILVDKRFDSAFDEETREQISILTTFGTEKKFQSVYTSRRFANLLGINQSMADFLFAFYAAEYGDVEPDDMTVDEFITFLNKDILGNRNFSSMFGKAEKAQINMLTTFTDTNVLLAPYTSTQMLDLMSDMGLNQTTVNTIYAIHHNIFVPCPLGCGGGDTACPACNGLGVVPNPSGVTVEIMTLSDFIDTLIGIMPPEQAAQLKSLQMLKDAALSGRNISAAEMGQITGMGSMITPMYVYHMARHSDYKLPSVVLYDLVDFIANDLASSGFGGDDLAQISIMMELMDAVLENTKYTADDLAYLVGMESDMLKILYAYHDTQIGTAKTWKVPLQTLVAFVMDDLVNGEFGSSLGEENINGLKMASTLMDGTLSGQRYTSDGLAKLIDMEELEPEMLKILYAYHINRHGDTNGWRLTLPEIVDFILADLVTDENFSDTFDKEALDGLAMLNKIIDGTLAGTAYSPEALANLLDMDTDMPRMLYLLRINRYGDTSAWSLPISTFIRFIHDDVLTDKDMAENIGMDNIDMLNAANRLVDSVITGNSYPVKGMSELFDGISQDLNANKLKLLYVYYFSRIDSDPTWTFSLYELFNYLSEDILHDPLFADVFDEDIRQTLTDSKVDLDDAIKQLSGPNYSIMMISTTFPSESEDTFMFIRDLIQRFNGNLHGNYYMIGNSPMNFEMSLTFGGEYFFITILTAIVIFVVIALTFRSLIIPAMLVLVIQCGIFLNVGFIGLQGFSIYYMALLIVQCILMCAAIDYGILFVSYYMEKRKTLGLKDALTDAYNGSIHTILTSGLILIFVTGILGAFFENPMVGMICQTISRGALCATILIIFVLPGIIAVCDRWIVKQKSRQLYNSSR